MWKAQEQKQIESEPGNSGMAESSFAAVSREEQPPTEEDREAEQHEAWVAA